MSLPDRAHSLKNRCQPPPQAMGLMAMVDAGLISPLAMCAILADLTHGIDCQLQIVLGVNLACVKFRVT